MIGTVTWSSGKRTDWLRYQVGALAPDSDADPELAPLWAGESCEVVTDIRPAGEVVRELASSASAAP